MLYLVNVVESAWSADVRNLTHKRLRVKSRKDLGKIGSNIGGCRWSPGISRLLFQCCSGFFGSTFHPGGRYCGTQLVQINIP